MANDNVLVSPANAGLASSDIQSQINANNVTTMPGYYTNVSGQSYVAQSGDSISKMLGTSDSQAIGNFMAANDLTNSTIYAGNNYFIPDTQRVL